MNHEHDWAWTGRYRSIEQHVIWAEQRCASPDCQAERHAPVAIPQPEAPKPDPGANTGSHNRSARRTRK